MKALTKYFEENPNMQQIDLSSQGITNLEELFPLLEKFENLNSVRTNYSYI